MLFGVKRELAKQHLCIQTIRSNVSGINLGDGFITIQCPKLPKDTDARIGVRRNPKNPDKKQKIFRYNLVLSASVEIHLKIELPVAVNNISGNAEEGSQLTQNKEQMHNHHECKVKIDIGDANMISSIAMNTSELKATSLLSARIPEMKTYLNKSSLIEVMIRKDGPLHAVGC